MSQMFTKDFWRKSTERAIKSAAQSVVLVWGVVEQGGQSVNAWDWDWQLGLGSAVGGATLSYLTSIISTKVGDPSSPSVV